MKRFKFDLNGSYIYYFGNTMGEAIRAFYLHRGSRLEEIVAITEEPVEDFEKP